MKDDLALSISFSSYFMALCAMRTLAEDYMHKASDFAFEGKADRRNHCLDFAHLWVKDYNTLLNESIGTECRAYGFCRFPLVFDDDSYMVRELTKEEFEAVVDSGVSVR